MHWLHDWRFDWFFYPEILEPVHLIPSVSLTWKRLRYSHVYQCRKAALTLSLRLWHWNLDVCLAWFERERKKP